MKKIAIIFALIASLTACISANQGAISETDLMHRNFLLVNFDGHVIVPENMTPRLEFGQNLFISGVMCNNFSGEARLTGNVIKASNMAVTQKLCIDPVKNQLDKVIGDMLTKGAEITLQDKTLTLKTAEHQLVFINRDWI